MHKLSTPPPASALVASLAFMTENGEAGDALVWRQRRGRELFGTTPLPACLGYQVGKPPPQGVREGRGGEAYPVAA